MAVVVSVSGVWLIVAIKPLSYKLPSIHGTLWDEHTHAYGTAPDGKQQTTFLRDLVSAHFAFSQTFAIEQFDGFFHRSRSKH
jgi:hypothetical protein